MIDNVTKVIDWLNINELDYFVVQLKDTDNSRVFEAEESLSREDNIAKFRKVMDISKGSRFVIRAAYKKNDKRGLFYEEFRNLDAEPTAAIGAMPHVAQAHTEADIDKLVDKRIAEIRMQEEFETMKRERDEFRREAERKLSISETFMERATPYIGTLAEMAVPMLGKFLSNMFAGGNTQIAMSGIETITTTTNNQNSEDMEINFTDEQTERIEIALQKLAAADNDVIEIIEKIAEMAANKDPMFAMAKNMLLKK